MRQEPLILYIKREGKTASSSKSSQLAPPPLALPTRVPIASAPFVELGIESAFPIEDEGVVTEQLHEVKLTFSRSSSIWVDDYLAEQFARSLIVLGDESGYPDLTTVTMIQRMRAASIRVYATSSF